ncbi:MULTISPECIES: aminoglycoside phosphotransferase family protein [unclassified Streptomyces]|uniref:phosphotransferase family protein n=1 Tax=unclassified Streptomyces TaxID=2593676 RepID=UPI00247408E1|nr:MULTISPECIES: aminoglycoside phosphotransferase family protein [unclassified Streptomyces]MDH6451114.1 aminoglycoside phosphotransferase (APT) family kinase protein [Streptomyces sp. SAI-119]MDH6498331.1 aminoglycoside phosphotransferase (APT) family kinase protein [Streptomyces sp. SAI-149]
MGATPAPRFTFVESDVVADFLKRAKEDVEPSKGHHNKNFVLPLSDEMARLVKRPPGTRVIVRVPRKEALRVVIRTWSDESAILKAVRRGPVHVPESLYSGDGFAVHGYVPGVPLSHVCRNDQPVDQVFIDALCGLLARLRVVPGHLLPPLPATWPADHRDSQGFMRALVLAAEEQIRKHNWTEFGLLFEALGVPEKALVRLAKRVPAMTRRPFGPLHGDLYRDNVIVSYDAKQPLICVDWELGSYGDPLYDLATHIIRMRYPEGQWNQVVDSWVEQMSLVCPEAVDGVHEDLRHYLAFERAQSVYPDIMRAARSLREGTLDRRRLDEAVATIHRAMDAAKCPLKLRRMPGKRRIERVLTTWLDGSGERGGRRRGGSGRFGEPVIWLPDRRVPEHPDFPRGAVTEALQREQEAPARWVFTGTTHVNTVVRVPAADFSVVVRRKRPDAVRLERGRLSEHAVLRLIEESKAPVAAPRVLALGENGRGERFALHTFGGDRHGLAPPEHPDCGLSYREADALVDQLVALRQIDGAYLDPTVCTAGYFYATQLDQLVNLVRGLPEETRQLADLLGLPRAERLREILWAQVKGRPPSLLHGDLRPQNLVRRDDDLALTLIDWEMALVGDPLYDLARHHHLTPARPGIREHMLRRWAGLMEEVFPGTLYEKGLMTNLYEDYSTYRRLEVARSVYLDLHRLVTGAGLDIPHVRGAVNAYMTTLAKATAVLGLLDRRDVNPYLTLALR